jgi:mannose-1-phosphate guanylyltransferase
MRAILLAGGYGTRLRPLTDAIPKCLVPIKGVPLLEYWITCLKKSGVEKLLINMHYLPDQVKNFITSSPFASDIEQVFEPDLLGTAGTLLANLHFYQDSDGLLIHADNYTVMDLAELIRAHEMRPKGCLLTMLTFKTDKPQSCGIVEIDSDGIAVRFHEKKPNPPGNLANGAVYILSRELLQLLPVQFSGVSDFSTEVLPKLLGKICCYETRDIFLDIGTPENYLKANTLK